jgi:hypothetical protein
MLKAISTSVLFGLLGTALPACAEESRHSSNRTLTDERKAVAKPHAPSQDRRHVSAHDNKYNHQQAKKHSTAPEHMAFKHPYSYNPSGPQSRYPYQKNHYPVTAYYQQTHQDQYEQHIRYDGLHYQTMHKSQPRLKLHYILPKQLAYSRVPTRVANRLGHLPAHLMRVRAGDDIAVIHIKNRIVHKIIRGLL